jgi:hypothetical protein
MRLLQMLTLKILPINEAPLLHFTENPANVCVKICPLYNPQSHHFPRKNIAPLLKSEFVANIKAGRETEL